MFADVKRINASVLLGDILNMRVTFIARRTRAQSINYSIADVLRAAAERPAHARAQQRLHTLRHLRRQCSSYLSLLELFPTKK